MTLISCGIRLALAVGRRSPRLGFLDRIRLGAGYDRWFPWHTATIARGTDRVRYQQPASGLGGYIGYVLDW